MDDLQREIKRDFEGRGVFVKKSESVEKPVERNSLILSISDGKLSAGDQAGAKSKKK